MREIQDMTLNVSRGLEGARKETVRTLSLLQNSERFGASG